MDTLSNDWVHPKEGSLVNRLGFGQDASVRDAVENELRISAMALGLPEEMFDEFMKLSVEDRAEFFADGVRKFRQRASFPSSGSENPERRASLVSLDAESAPEFASEIRQRRVVTGGVETRERAREYLSGQYTSADGLMHRQACQLELPFQVKSRWYFEAVRFLPERARAHHQNVLALCPLCAAKYNYVRDTPDDAFLAGLLELEIAAGDGQSSIPISLNSQRVVLMFTAKHAIDLKAVMSSAGEGHG
ncbi:hypothetical protein [Cryobacterium sp. Hb1]|uniref:hypothetical protein n=1 Tax=Cryobacterium sp. Hb1 TaxID=1259147 RepID=UPI00106DB608|nr:hypothetical protein [Cryobacterium sp. Hb1]TFD70500.1 hypothetical protein E3T38_05585 [Cryobacterium sp. Hb1]